MGPVIPEFEASESVEVAATAPTVNTEDAQIAGVETRDELTLLPTNQRSTITLFMLSSFNYHAVGSSYSLGGLRGNDTNFTIDGTTSNSNTFGAQSGPQTEVSFESLRDVQAADAARCSFTQAAAKTNST